MSTEINEAKSDHKFFAELLGKLNRQMALAGIAIVWIFRGEAGAIATIPKGLIPALFCFAFTLIFDFIYLVVMTKCLDIALDNTEKIKPPPTTVNFPSAFALKFFDYFYYIKLLPMIIGYSYLIIYMIQRYF